jgi:hypothetical protein
MVFIIVSSMSTLATTLFVDLGNDWIANGG